MRSVLMMAVDNLLRGLNREENLLKGLNRETQVQGWFNFDFGSTASNLKITCFSLMQHAGPSASKPIGS